MLKAIEDIWPSNVFLQIVIDNAKNCQAAGKGTEKIHKHILKDFANAFRDTYKVEKNTAKYYINDTHILATFRNHSKLELPKVAKTRFG